MPASPDYITSREYEERVYAGVLGKIIGVYLGRPFEGWPNDRIERELGEVNYYVHERLERPLVVTDDDISGTFTFVRALAENGYDPNLTAAQIGDWWLNTLIENRTILWWGGMAMSTEHTAYIRLKSGLKAPDSGAIATNGTIVAEQIGAQIFVDGWGMVCPGDPERAAHFARLAASVSHDGAAIHGAQVVAAMEALAFVEPDLDKLLDAAAALIPRDGVIYKLIADVRGWASQYGDDWRATFRQIQAHYGYDKFGGNCHMVPNHAVILLGLLHGKGDFQRSLMITNTAGWDTDCNSANVGCLMGIRGGLDGIDAGPNWRGPVADKIYLPTADGGRCISDAVRETFALVNTARALAGQPATAPKNSARFHFSLPGSVQGFRPEDSPDVRGTVSVGNEDGQLALRLSHLAPGRAVRVATDTFVTPQSLKMGGYGLVASPTLYSGQTVAASVSAPALSGPVSVCLYVQVFGKDNALAILRGPAVTLAPQTSAELTFTIPDTTGQPIAQIGLEATAAGETVSGLLCVDRLTWNGTPTATLGGPDGGEMGRRAWVNAADHFDGARLIQDAGTGMVTQGEWEWTNYTVTADVLPHLAARIGLIAAARGLRRYVALVLDSDKRCRLIEQRDDARRTLAESDIIWELEKPLSLSVTVTNAGISARVGDAALTATGNDLPTRGAVGMMVEVGHAEFSAVRVSPA